MADFTFNGVLGQVAYYAGVPGSGSLIAVLLKNSGLEIQTTLEDYRNLSTLLAASNDEATDASYARKTLTALSVSIDDTNNWVICTGTIPTWVGLAGVQLAKNLICYKPPGSPADSAIIPLTAHDAAITPDTPATDVTLTVPSTGFCKITKP